MVEPRSGITKSTVIFIHGRGATGEEFADEMFAGINIVNNPIFENTKWLFPTAPSSYSEQFEIDLTEWFDLASTSNPHNQPGRQVEGLTASVKRISQLINDEIQQGVPASNIILGGMSQGYATAAHVLKSYLLSNPDEPLGGFIGISGWIPFAAEHSSHKDLDMASAGSFRNIEMPVLLMHSKNDNVIEVDFGREARDAISTLGLKPMYKEYKDGEHTVTKEGYGDIEMFISGIIGTQ